MAANPGAQVHDLKKISSPTAAMEEEAKHLHALDLQERAILTEARRQTYRYHEDQPRTTLGAYSMPLVGLGTWKSARGEVRSAVATALRCGYRHIDCAAVYGNEHEVGEGIAEVLQEGVLTRDDIWVTSKLWNTEHDPSAVKAACQKTLTDLGLDHLDLYLVHWPVTGVAGAELKPSLEETWRAMEGLVDEDLVRCIGVSNFSVKKLDSILAIAKHKPSVNQVEAHPYWRNDALLAHCKRHDIHVTAYSPLGSPDSAAMFKRKLNPSLLRDPLVLRLAERYHTDAGQVLIRWAIQRGTSVLPKSVSPARIAANLDAVLWHMDEVDFKRLSSIDLQMRMVDGSFFLSPQGPYRTTQDLWDEPDPVHTPAQLARAHGYDLAAAEAVPRVLLGAPGGEGGTAKPLPLVGLGTWKSQPGEVRAAVAAALRCGYRHIDCAAVYGNEHEVGEALAEVLAEGFIRREDIFITSKLWNTEHAHDKVAPACKKSIKDLQCEYLDLYLVHWPVTGVAGAELRPSLEETWRAMEGLVDEGLVRCIGVSNFSVKKLDSILAIAKHKPSVNQVEAHPYWRNDALLAHCRRHDIHVTAYSPLGSPDSAAMLKRSEALPVLMKDPVVTEIAARLHKSPAQVLVRWAIQRGTSVLPKSVSPARIAANLDAAAGGWELAADDFVSISSLPTQMRMLDGSFWTSPEGPYKTVEQLWDEPAPKSASA